MKIQVRMYEGFHVCYTFAPEKLKDFLNQLILLHQYVRPSHGKEL
jgi:hypothetical protein